MQAHADDLRSEVARDWSTLSTATDASDRTLDQFVHQAAIDWRQCPLPEPVTRLLEYVEQLTHRPSACCRDDVDRLRACGWSDSAIHDAVQVAAYFNYINRIADGLGVENEPGSRRWGQSDMDDG